MRKNAATGARSVEFCNSTCYLEADIDVGGSIVDQSRAKF